jgi:hypothetical protein
MPITRKRLFGPAALTNVAATKYTVPAGTKTTIRQMVFNNTTGSPHTITFSIGADAAGTELRTSFAVPANTAFDYGCFIIMDAAEIFQAFADAGASVTLSIFGEEATL